MNTIPEDSETTNPLRVQLPIWFVLPLVLLTLLIGVGGGVLAGMLIQRPAAGVECPESPEVCEEFAVFWEAWQLARDNYVDPEAIVPAAMIEGAVNGMLDTLGDQGHTRFLSASDAEEWDESLRGTFEGIGAYVAIREEQAIIVAPIDGAPAQAAGLRPGDAIVSVDGESTDGWTIEELVARIRGPRGTTVTLGVVHIGDREPIEIEVTRAQVEVPAVSWRMLPNQVAYVRLNSFDDNSGDELRDALAAALDQGAEGVVFDLRNNPGGLLNQAVAVASQFLPADTTVLLEQNRAGERTRTTTVSGGVALDVPLVVLINAQSASSAEIVAGAFQSAGRAMLVGETTFGTGTVLSQYRLNGGARLLLGTEQWLTPEGEQIRGQGVAPDVEVFLPVDAFPLSPAEAEELELSELLAADDIQLSRAIEMLQQTIGQ
jgi:carboxyl-terminal processing protease